MNESIDINSFIDHTLLRPEARDSDIEKICIEAIENNFASVCVLPAHVKAAVATIEYSTVPVCTVVGFPLGATYSSAKEYEADIALLQGAGELDIVMNIPDFINGRYSNVLQEIETLVRMAHRKNATIKIIIETALLNRDQKIMACEIVKDSGADYIKTSTGFAESGAKLEDIKLLKENAGERLKIKASGGINTADFAWMLIEAGASRIGTSSAMRIIREFKK